MSDHRFAVADRHKQEPVPSPSAGQGLGMLAAFGLLDEMGLGDAEDDTAAVFTAGGVIVDLSAPPAAQISL